MIYCFGGEKSGYIQVESLQTPEESIWGFSPNNQDGTGTWEEVVGPTADQPWPQDLVRPANGYSTASSDTGYFFGGYVDSGTSPKFSDLTSGAFQFLPGLVTFNFDSRVVTNSTNVANPSKQWVLPGQLVNVPVFGPKGVLIAIGGGPGQTDDAEAGGNFNNITIFDVDSQQWYSQVATGDVPEPASEFCTTGIQGGDNSTFEM